MILVIDADASKVIEAVRSTGVVITRPMIEYAHYLISNMKNIGTWQLSNAVYGFVGGTAASHKWNWKDLRDVDAAFRLTYGGTVTHSANGMQGNGTTGFANTNLNPATSLTIANGISFFGYNKTANTLAAATYGSLEVLSPSKGAFMADRPTSLAAVYGGYLTSLTLSTGLTGSYGLGIKQSLNTGYAYTKEKYNSGISLLAGYSTTLLPNYPFTLLGRNTDGLITPSSNALLSFFAITNYITDTQAIQQSQIVTNAQLILNRA